MATLAKSDLHTAAPLPAIVLAAGMSRRMGHCKLELPFCGQPILAHALHNALASGVLAPLIVVVGPQTPLATVGIISALAETTSASATAPAAQLRLVHLVTADNAMQGQAESLKAGLARILDLCPDAPGVAVLLGDQPLICPGLLQKLHAEFWAAQACCPCCVAPTFDGQRGNPVFLPRALFKRMGQLCGDEGARSLLAALPLRLVLSADDGCLRDVDTPDQYDSLVLLSPSYSLR